MGITFDNLLDERDWTPMSVDQQANPRYFWLDGGTLADAPVDFAATFDGAMFTTLKPIDVPSFNRNPLKVVPNFVVPRHHHNCDEMIFVFAGEYNIEHDDDDGKPTTTRVRPGRDVPQQGRHAVHDDGRSRGGHLHRDVADPGQAARDRVARRRLGPPLTR